MRAVGSHSLTEMPWVGADEAVIERVGEESQWARRIVAIESASSACWQFSGSSGGEVVGQHPALYGFILSDRLTVIRVHKVFKVQFRLSCTSTYT